MVSEFSSRRIFPTLPFLDQMGLTAILSMIVIAIVSIKENKISDDKKAIKLDKGFLYILNL